MAGFLTKKELWWIIRFCAKLKNWILNCYFLTFRYNPDTKVFTLDSKNPDFSLYEEYLETQARYNMLKAINPDKAEELLRKNKENAIARFNYYKELEEKQGN